LLLLFLSACVSTQQGGFEVTTSQQIVTARVEAAKHYLQRRDFTSARRHLQAAAALAPRSAEVQDALALLFYHSGEADQSDITTVRCVIRRPRVIALIMPVISIVRSVFPRSSGSCRRHSPSTILRRKNFPPRGIISSVIADSSRRSMRRCCCWGCS